MAMHHITKDGYSTVLKTSVEHSPEFWRMIDQLFKLDALIDVRDPLAATTEVEFDVTAIAAESAIAEYATSIAPGCGGNLRNAFFSHTGRLRYEAAERAEVEWVA
jgi:hypothetical protein